MREIVVTADGSHTVAIPELKVTYHSQHGAVQESLHVFIEAGLRPLLNHSGNEPLQIFEMGFGTGLNAFLTAIEAKKTGWRIHYTAVEAFPLILEETLCLNYPATLGHTGLFQQLHRCEWNEAIAINPFFTLEKLHVHLVNVSTSQRFNLIYYDAFAPSAQPELWTKEVFEKLFAMMKPGGVLVTYCSKGEVRRAMQAAGFVVEKLPGPKGKREMVRARLKQ